MRKQLAIAAAAILTVSGLSARSFAEDDMNKMPANNVGATTQPMSAAAAPGMADTREIQTVLAQTVSAAVTKDGYSTFAGMLSKADRDRIGDTKASNNTELDGRIDQFQKDWQAKYGQDFKLSDKESTIFGDGSVKIVKGDAASMDARIMADKLPANTVPPGNEKVDPAIIQHDKSAVNGITKTAAEQNGVPKMVNVELAGMQSCPACTLHLVNEGALVNAWKFDVADTMDNAKLHDSLKDTLTKIDEDKANWPSDINQAYMAVSHQILGILGNKPMTAETNAMTPTANQ